MKGVLNVVKSEKSKNEIYFFFDLLLGEGAGGLELAEKLEVLEDFFVRAGCFRVEVRIGSAEESPDAGSDFLLVRLAGPGLLLGLEDAELTESENSDVKAC